MALITCIECGKEFSEYAKVCPNCGCPTEVILKNAGATLGHLSNTGNTLSQNNAGMEKQAPVQQARVDVTPLLRRDERFLENGDAERETEQRRAAAQEEAQRRQEADKEEKKRSRKERWEQESETLTAKAAEVAKRFCDSFLATHDSHYFQRSMSDKLKRGLGIPQIKDSEVYLAHDDTIFKTGKNGYAITKQGIYFRDMLKKAECLSYKELAEIDYIYRDFADDDGLMIHADGYVIPITIPNDDDVQKDLLNLFQNIAKAVQEL